MSTFEELQQVVTADEARELLRELVITSPAQIPAEVLDTETTPEAAIVYALGEAEASRSSDRALFARSATRSTASDAYVRVIAREQFSLPPRTESFATTNIVLNNASTSFYGPFGPGELVVRNAVSKALYQNVASIGGIPPGTTGLLVGVIALEAGSASSALPNEITELETTLSGVTITNSAAALADDDEPGDKLNARIDAKIGSLGEPGARGWNTGATSTAFESVAKNGPDDGGGCIRDDGSRIEVTRTQVVRNDLAGTIQLWVADDDGPILGSDLSRVSETVIDYTEWLGLSGVSVLNSSLATVTYDGTLTIYAKSVSATDDAIKAAAALELTAASRALQIGEGPTLTYGRNAILNAGDAGKATAFRVKELVLTSPLADTVLTPGAVVAMVLGTLTIVRV